MSRSVSTVKSITIEQATGLLIQAMTVSDKSIRDVAYKLGGEAIYCPTARNYAVYRPARTAHAPMLVAHTDTVWDNAGPVVPVVKGRKIVSGVKGRGIGADDRSGVAMLLYLAEANPTWGFLLIPEEEIGGLGASDLAGFDSLGEQIADTCSILIELDRYGSRQIATYHGCISEESMEILQALLPDWLAESGSYTDIATLAPAWCMAGVNLSVGYTHQHTQNESQDVPTWVKSLNEVQDLGDALIADGLFLEAGNYSCWSSMGYFNTKTKTKIGRLWAYEDEGEATRFTDYQDDQMEKAARAEGYDTYEEFVEAYLRGETDALDADDIDPRLYWEDQNGMNWINQQVEKASRLQDRYYSRLDK